MGEKKQVIRISNRDERRTVAAILVSEGYTVRETKIKVGKTTRTVIEFWEGQTGGRQQ